MTTLAFIDDEINILNAIKRLLRNTGWSVLTFSSSEMAIGELGARDDINIIVSDYHMIGMSGVELLNTFKKYTPNALRILLSGQADLQAVTLAINEAEIYRFITKPWIDEEFLITLTRAVQHQALMEENIRLSNLVRNQQACIDFQHKELQRLEQESPGLTKVKWDKDGYIDISDDVGSIDE